MKKLLLVLMFLIPQLGCSPINPPTPGSSCTGNNGLAGVVGSDSNCWTCSGSNYAYYGYTVGYCGSENGAGVSCCNNSYVGYGTVVCNKPGYPWLCDDGQCWSQSNGNGSLVCVYDP